MKFTEFNPKKLFHKSLLAAILVFPLANSYALDFGAAGWMQYGQIANSTDTVGGLRFNGRGLLKNGAQFSLRSAVTEKLSIVTGVGVEAGHSLPGPMESQFAGGFAPMGMGPYVSEANFTYQITKSETSQLYLRGGLYPYNYAPDNQNLGLYLLRGPVYPGYVLSGFETKYVLPVANTMGLQLHHEVGSFRHDLLLNIETEFYPFYDLSPAYVASMGFGSVFRMGAGVNLYHWIPMDKKLIEDPTTTEMVYVQSDSVGGTDTTHLTFRGTKFMTNFSIDLKPLFNWIDVFGAEDLKIYGEVALIGLESDLSSKQKIYIDSLGVKTGASHGLKREQVYKKLYGDKLHRMPMMVGFNFPTFKFLDRLGFEIEWYGARNKDDLASYNHFRGNHPRPKPIYALDTNYRRDNWKWSIYSSKLLNKHVKVSVQAASDHYRPGIFIGYGDTKPPKSPVIFRSPSEWYWMTKIAYFF